MLRHYWAITVLLTTLIGLIAPATAQTTATGTPATAYRQKGKWVGYVPPHQKYSQTEGEEVFRSSLPDVTSFLTGKTDRQVKAAKAVEPLKKSVEPFKGTLLDSEETGTRPRVLAVAFDEPTPAFGPGVNVAPEYDPGVEMFDDTCSTGCGSCATAPTACCPPPRFYGTAEYLLWWTDSMATPPLATTSPAGTPQAQAGVLGQPGTSILFGGSGLENGAVSGGRFSLGMWLDPCQMQGVEASYFMLGTQTESFGASSADYRILARPFYNTVEGQQDSRLIAYDGLVAGSLDVTAATKFDGGEVLFRQAVQRDCWAEIDLLVGYRWLQLEEGLLIEESTQALTGAFAGTSFELFDEFETRNSFHGGEVGMAIRGQVARCWSLELLAKIAVGNVNSTAMIDGQTTAVTTTGTTTTDGGLLTQPTNMGNFNRHKIGTGTELGVKLRRVFVNGIDLTIGYTFLYLSDVLRPGDQIDPYINVSQLPPGPLEGAALPQFGFHSTGFWAQGLSFGIEGRF